jgi:type IV pilus assembly protein PilQ
MGLGPVLFFVLFAVLLGRPVLAAELLDVKPIVNGSAVVIEVTADIPMTYTYYKVPGQVRAVVDIADADPEKVEPLIVVNKGAVASISVDKAMIADMTVSRLVFNLVSESDISVSHSPDRKTLNVSFGGGKPVMTLPAPASAPEPEVPVAVSAGPVSEEEGDPLGLDDLETAALPAKDPSPAARTATMQPQPIVPLSVDQGSPDMVVVKGIIVGASFIEIQADGSVEKYKAFRLDKPQRLSIEIPGTSTVSVNSVQVKRFGVSKVRIGATPGFVRVVLDSARPAFPRYEIVSVESGLRINFK